jgi:hypothetical protein
LSYGILGVETKQEVRCEVLLEDRQAACPSALRRMEDAGSRRAEQDRLVEVGDAADMGDREIAGLIEPRLHGVGHCKVLG